MASHTLLSTGVDMPRNRILRIALLSALLATGAGCQTTVGNYFANRAHDFGDMFRLQVGVGLGLGVDVRAAGIVHVPVIYGLNILAPFGPAYGRLPPYYRPEPEGEIRALNDSLVGAVVAGLPISIISPWVGPADDVGLHFAIDRLIDERHRCYLVIPGIASWRGKTWIWDARAPTRDRVHAFDVEVMVFALVVNVVAGFSPGELLDFVLGWFGVDIAGDDDPLAPKEEPAQADGAEVPQEE